MVILNSANDCAPSRQPRCIDLGADRRAQGTYRIEVTGIEVAGETPWLVVARDPERRTCSEMTLAPPEADRLHVYVTITHAFDQLRLILPSEARLSACHAARAKRMHRAALLTAALRRAPLATLAATGWRLIGKRVRARNRLHRVLGPTACFDYGLWLERKAAGTAPPGTTGTVQTDTIEVVMLSRTGPATTIAPAGASPRSILVLGPGMRLADGALVRIAEAAVAHPEAAVIYWDDDIVDADGNRRAPRFKPGWSPDTFLATSYIGAALIRKSALDPIGGLDPHAGTAALDAAILAIAASHPRTAIVRIADVLSHRHDEEPADLAADAAHAMRVRAAHLARHEPDAMLQALDGAPHLFRVSRPLPAASPLVSVIVPTRDRLDLLQPCLEGVLRHTQYPAIEVVVADNGSEEPATRAYLEELVREEPRARVIDVPGPFNYAAINNTAVRAARGDVLCFLNNDIEVLEPDWLALMVAHALRPGLGAVGAKLLYPGGIVQHGGVILGLNGLAGHAHRFFPARHPGYMDRLRTEQNYAAVTAACLVVQRARFEAVGGFDATHFAVAFNDVDLCLKLLEAGYLNLWTPHATLLHKESASRVLDYAPAQRARFDAECAALKARWSHLLADDPFYNPNLTQLREDFTVD